MRRRKVLESSVVEMRRERERTKNISPPGHTPFIILPLLSSPTVMDCVRHWASKEDKYPHIFTHKKCWQNQHKLFNLLKSKTRIILTSNHLSLCKEGTTGTFWYQHLVLTLYTFYKKSCQKVKLAAGTLFGRIHQFNFRHLQSKLCEQQVKLLFLEGQLDSSKVFPLRIQMLI